MLKNTDEQLIEKALKGNKSAWLKLVKRHEKAIYNYGLRMTGNPEDALDLMQDVFLSVFRNLSSFRAEAKFTTWLFRIANYRCIELHRKKKFAQGMSEESEPTCDLDGPEHLYIGDEDKNRLTAAMLTLPVAQRSVIELKFFGHFTFNEIADQLGVSSNTIKTRFYSALDKLKSTLEVDYVDT